jgi:hypothetical protein
MQRCIVSPNPGGFSLINPLEYGLGIDVDVAGWLCYTADKSII